MKVFQAVVCLTFLLARCESGGDAGNGGTSPHTGDNGTSPDGNGPPPDGTDVAQGDEGATDSSDDPVPADVPPDTAPPPAYDLTGDWILTATDAPGIVEPVSLTMEPDGALTGEVNFIDGHQGWLRGENFFLRKDYDYGSMGYGFHEYAGAALSSHKIEGEYHFVHYEASGELEDEVKGAFTMQR